MKFNRITTTNFFEQESPTGSLVKAILYTKTVTNNKISFDDNFVLNYSKWILCFIKGDGSINEINTSVLDNIMIGNDNTGYIIWLDDYKSLNDGNYAQRFKFLKLKRNVIISERLYQVVSHNSKYDFVINKFRNQSIVVHEERIDFSNPKDVSFKINNCNSKLDNVSLDLSQPETFGSFIIETTFGLSNKSFINAKIGYISEKQSGDSLVAYDIFDKSDLDNAQFSGTYYPFEEVYDSINKKYLSSFKISKPNLKTNFIDSLGSKYYSDFDNSDLSFCFSRVVDNRVSGGNDPQWDKYVLRPLGKLKLKTITNSKILLGSSGTETFKNVGNELDVIFEDSENIVVDEKNNLLKKHNVNTKTSLLKITPISYNIDSEKSPLFKNKEVDLKPIDYADIFFSSPTSEALPIIPTLSFKDNPELFELDEVFKKIRLKAHQKVRAKKLNKSTDAVDFLESPDDYITPQGFQRNTNGYEFISKQNGFQFSLENIDTNLDLSLRKDQVFFVLTPLLFKEYAKKVEEETGKKPEIRSKFAINKDSSTGDEKIEFVVDLTSSYYPEKPNSTSHSESIVLFKFHREKLSKLIGDLKLWTNEGLLNDDLKAIQTAIIENKNFKDDYFTSILNDENWNGVLILSIPITDSKNLPKIFTGLSSSQDFFKKETDRISLKTKLKFQYAAFPVNKTKIENGKIEIKSTSFYGLIDYNPFANTNDYNEVKKHFGNGNAVGENDPYKFLLSKLKICFVNSSIDSFESFAFIQVPKLFDDILKFKEIYLANGGFPAAPIKINNLISLSGSYQKNSTGAGEISFQTDSLITITLPENDLIGRIEVSKLGFNIKFDDPKNEGNDKFRFDINSEFFFNDVLKNLFSFDKVQINNVGLKFDFPKTGFPNIKFDKDNWLVIPGISFNGNGFLRSFPIRFSHFKIFEFEKIQLPNENFDFEFPNGDFDFFKFPESQLPKIDLGIKSSLFSFIFDFDLGTLGNLGGLKDLKGQLLIGWTFKAGFVIGFKLNGPSSKGLHLDLFGALKLDVEELTIGKFNPKNTGHDIGCTAYFLRLNDAKLTVLGTQIPKEKTFDGVIISDFSDSGLKKIAWLINLSNNVDKKLLLGLGQRSGPKVGIDTSTTRQAIEDSRLAFISKLEDCKIKPEDIGFQPERNWFIASEDVMSLISDEWAKTLDIKFIFNDPKLYGLYLGFKGEFLKGFFIDILYKKLSDSLGVYSTEIQLPDALRNKELGGASLRLPNIGIEIYTNGDWKGDIGFPKNGNDWSRSGFIQLNTAPPFVGWFGFYIMQSQVPELTLFGEIPLKDVNIIQAGFALRVGLGAYIEGGIFYVGASISVYGILEGTFAFKKNDKGLSSLFPDHFAVLGRVGAIAELVGYVNFVIIKASIYISLRAEFGLLLIYLSERVGNYSRGLQPVKVYIEGEVVVAIRVTLFCVRFFRKKWCLVVHLRFSAYVRFEYTIGGNGSSNKIAAKQQFKLAEANNLKPYEWKLESLKELPMVFIPTFTRRKESATDKEETLLISNFYIPFFGVRTKDGKLEPSKSNIFKDKIIQPFLNDLISRIESVIGIGKVRYEHLRGILLDGKLVDIEKSINAKVNITIPKYRPKFIKGTNDHNWDKLKAILEEEFFFKQYDEIDEFEEFKKSIEIEDCINKNLNINKCPYRAIPAPISKSIIINGNEVLDGFEIKIEELVSDSEDEKNEVKVKIDAIDKINGLEIGEPYLNKLEAFFDAYKTQFIKRNELNKKLLDYPKIDLREDFIIPEFFKLAALLTLEKSYSKSNRKEKKGESYNPLIRISNGNISFSTDNIDWKEIKTNESIEEVIGQLNYFYNSGLRLPKDETANEETISINELIHHSTVINPIKNPTPDAWKNVKISIAGQDITSNIYGSGNDKQETVEGIWRFVDSLENTDFTKLKNEFSPVNFLRPYKLIDVTLGIQSNHKKVLNPDKSENRFYEIPKKLFKHGSIVRKKKATGSMFSFELAIAKAEQENAQGSVQRDKVIYSTNPNTYLPEVVEKIELAKCLNIQIQVKQSVRNLEDGTSGKVILELINVLAEDLTLITLLKDEEFNIDNISFYGKEEVNGKVNLKKLTDLGSTIIKTNLSPRTAPPIFDSFNFKKEIESTLNQFIEDSNNSLDTGKRNFVRLVWEALTTNSGGYYLAFDNSTEFPKDLKEIVVSFESDESKKEKVPYFFNAINLKDAKGKAGEEDLFVRLDKNELYLYIEQLYQDEEPVFEYHPTIPSHDFGFEIEKAISKEEHYQQYLPLEFGLKEKSAAEDILSMNKILPIMPSSPKKEVDGNSVIDNDKAFYSHISPLILNTEDNTNNINRYSTVGKGYELKLGLRDIYGFRTNIDFKEKEKVYKHLYFDKLIPVDAWPLIKFSYWFAGYNRESDTLHWILSGNYDIRELLDLAGVERDGKGEHKYRYQFGENINNEQDRDLIEDASEGILNTLYSVLAQLTDDNAQLSISYRELTNSEDKEELKCKIKLLIKDIELVRIGKMPRREESIEPIEILITTEGLEKGLEREISFEISVFRNDFTFSKELERNPKLDDAYTDKDSLKFEALNKASVWEYKSVEKVSTSIQASNGTDGTSNLKSLNGVIKEKTQEKSGNKPEDKKTNRYSLAISVDKNLNKVIHLVNDKALKSIKVKAKHLDQSEKINRDESYVGIKPMHNKLWIGKYRVNDKVYEFSDIDIDQRLRVVLEKIDSLLDKDSISSNLIPEKPIDEAKHKDLIEKLIAAKKAVVENKLIDQVDWVMKSINITKAKEEFKEILLNKLTNFYAYDGAVAIEIEDKIIPEGYRLSLALETVKDYNLISSKITSERQWNIFFDQEESIKDSDNEFSIKPKITHIERDVVKVPGSEIEKSTWIQLLDPIEPTISTYHVYKWQKIIREFPPKPVIIKHEAKQTVLSGNDWTINNNNGLPDAGQWEYSLRIEDKQTGTDEQFKYKDNDRIEIKLLIQNFENKSLDEERSFEGLVSYWSDKITNSNVEVPFKWDDFTNDIFDFFLEKKELKKSEDAVQEVIIVTLEKKDGIWKPEKEDLGNSLKANVGGSDNPELNISGFNIFNSNQKVFSILPQVRVLRNHWAENKEFRYETDEVQPASAATPLIKHYKPLRIGKSDTFSEKVFKFKNPQFPFKATAKYLVDIDADFPSQNTKPLPVIPVQLIECDRGHIEKPDEIFSKFDKSNGYSAFAYTIYNDSDTNGDLPIFYADTIFKSK